MIHRKHSAWFKKNERSPHSVKIIDFILPVNLRILKIIRHQRTLDQTPSVADEKAKTQGEMTCLSNSRWSQNKDSGLWLSCLLTYV